MAAIICELCGSNDIQKQDGVFVCQHCGTKYSLEEAKKLIGTVKVDRSDETEKYLVLARRAREDDNSENAEKYYSLVLQEDPNNWEAYFFQVYYKAMQCRVMDISSAALSIANSIDSTMQLISKLPDKEEQKKAIDMVITFAQGIAQNFAIVSINHYNQFSTTDNAMAECSSRIVAAKSIFEMLEKSLKKNFPWANHRILAVQKAENSFISGNAKFINSSYVSSETSRLTSEIQAKDTSYKKPAVQSGGCYIATAVYGSYNCPEVWTLRRYRDNTLASSWYGRSFIRFYYALSPTLVKWFGNKTWFKSIWKPALDHFVKKLNSHGVLDTPYNDK